MSRSERRLDPVNFGPFILLVPSVVESRGERVVRPARPGRSGRA